MQGSIRRLGIAATLACCAWVGISTAAEPSARLVKDPHYGDSLFQFYQSRYFTSVTGLMVSQHFNRVTQHADEAEVLRGGLLLSYGMHREAGQIFAQLIERNASPAVQDRAWFYLAKIRYQRGFGPEAEEAIARIGKNLPADLEEDRVLLKAQLEMARGAFAAAAGTLAALATTSEAALYARYNLGVALLRSGDVVGGTAQLDTIGKTKGTQAVATEEHRSLRDKANVAMGYAALQDNRPDDARSILQRVRLDSMHANKALLGFGWAAATLKQPRQALVPWNELTVRDASDASVLEARIAVPFALAEAGALGQALDRYNAAIDAFEQEKVRLDESAAAIRGGGLVGGLIERNPGEEMGWFWSIRDLPGIPHGTHLVHVLAQHDFQEAFKNFRDLQFLARNLSQWNESVATFSDMLANRRAAYAERLPRVHAQMRTTRLEALAQQRAQLASELDAAQTAADGRIFADVGQRAMLERLNSVQSALQQPGMGGEMDLARERARRVAGALTWELAQQQPARLWDARKNLRAADAGLSEVARRDAALEAALRDEPLRFERLSARIAALTPRIHALIPRVAALSNEQQGVVQELAVAELARQKARLAAYTLQARFAIAQLYDRAQSKVGLDGKAEDATKP